MRWWKLPRSSGPSGTAAATATTSQVRQYCRGLLEGQGGFGDQGSRVLGVLAACACLALTPSSHHPTLTHCSRCGLPQPLSSGLPPRPGQQECSPAGRGSPAARCCPARRTTPFDHDRCTSLYHCHVPHQLPLRPSPAGCCTSRRGGGSGRRACWAPARISPFPPPPPNDAPSPPEPWRDSDGPILRTPRRRQRQCAARAPAPPFPYCKQ